MASLEGLFPLIPQAGIKRDGTQFEGNYYSDGLWCRYQRGKPRKIGGYNLFSGVFTGPVRGCYIDKINNTTLIHVGSSRLELLSIENGQNFYDRTPVGLNFPNMNWQFCTLFDAGGNSKKLIAYPALNLSNIEDGSAPQIYYGDIQTTTPLVTTGQAAAGGIFSMDPYLFILDNYGYVRWSDANQPADFTNGDTGSARIAANKLIKGVKTRGGSGASPAGLIWSIDELYRVTYVGAAAVFAFDYIGDTSLLSTNGVVEYNGRYYWPDINRFCTYNGLIEDLPNSLNLNYFYDNLNVAQRQKVWGIKIPRYNEIWWFWPKGDATECTDVLIYNVAEKTWYDTAWSGGQGARTTGVYNKSLGYPMMFGVDANQGGKYNLYQHEFGVDRAEGASRYAIQSYFDTCDISYCANIAGGDWVGQDRWVQLQRIEPDFVQTGEMTVTVSGKPYAQSESVSSEPVPFRPDTGKLDMKEQRREMRLRFESNVVGGDYQLGQTMLTMQLGDGRQ